VRGQAAAIRFWTIIKARAGWPRLHEACLLLPETVCGMGGLVKKENFISLDREGETLLERAKKILKSWVLGFWSGKRPSRNGERGKREPNQPKPQTQVNY